MYRSASSLWYKVSDHHHQHHFTTVPTSPKVLNQRRGEFSKARNQEKTLPTYWGSFFFYHWSLFLLLTFSGVVSLYVLLSVWNPVFYFFDPQLASDWRIVRPSLKTILFPVHRPGDLISAEWVKKKSYFWDFSSFFHNFPHHFYTVKKIYYK